MVQGTMSHGRPFMYTTVLDQAEPTSDLAARLTDLALEILAGAGTRGNSVETELKLWHALRAELDREFRWQHFTRRYGGGAPPGRALPQGRRRRGLRSGRGRHPLPRSSCPPTARATAR